MQIVQPICTFCKHFNVSDSSCAAYPNRIPEDILDFRDDHSQIRRDQVGNTIFEVIPEKEQDYHQYRAIIYQYIQSMGNTQTAEEKLNHMIEALLSDEEPMSKTYGEHLKQLKETLPAETILKIHEMGDKIGGKMFEELMKY